MSGTAGLIPQEKPKSDALWPLTFGRKMSIVGGAGLGAVLGYFVGGVPGAVIGTVAGAAATAIMPWHAKNLVLTPGIL